MFQSGAVYSGLAARIGGKTLSGYVLNWSEHNADPEINDPEMTRPRLQSLKVRGLVEWLYCLQTSGLEPVL